MKKAAKRKKSKNTYTIPLFWVVFFAVIILLFVINLPLIRKTINATHLGERLTGLPLIIEENAPEAEPAEQIAPEIAQDADPSLEELIARLNEGNPGIGENPVADTSGDAVANTNAVEDARERSVYFMRLDADGTLVRIQAKRQMQNSSSPLGNTINILLGGVTTTEEARGITTLIPSGTVLINAAMRGSTAILNFNENFMFNNYGVEGYLAQLRQIIWTATEFSSVKNVQFLIEGQRIDFLGDNIRLDQPISREDLE
jgi:hypothetical protein